jgi:hypothetical protein
MKHLIALAVIFAITFILFDAVVASGVVITAALLMLPSKKTWLAVGEGFAEMLPWIMIANIDL